MKKSIMCIFFLIYAILGCTYVFFSDSKLNRVLSTKIGFAHLYSFSTLVGCIAIVISVVTVIIITLRNGFELKIDMLNIILILTIIFSILFVFCGTTNRQIGKANAEGKTIKLVEWNVANNINEKDVRDIFGEFGADIAVFPELEGYEKGDKSNRRLADLFKKANVDFEDYNVYISKPTSGRIAPVTVVIKKEFGGYNIYRETPMTRFGTVYLSPKSNDIPPVIGLHTAPPLIGLMSIWEDDLSLIAKIANDNREAVIIGDFNATMKHGSLNNIKTHEDVLEYAPKFKSGTWNKDIPSIFRPRIDHILIPKSKYNVKNVEIKSYYNSDHLCIFAEIEKIQ